MNLKTKSKNKFFEEIKMLSLNEQWMGHRSLVMRFKTLFVGRQF
jgi:hypothetical protein